ncbi:MAG: 3-hydroxyacyl-CoA dehydrogenase family protein [Gammaproteobacteria bacterium]|nr:3-hydroxyacyl-CoA dehydrogenase family protein [Gammaproteobacteria bacterium]
MGSSIASQVLMSGLRVTVVEAKSDAARRAQDRIVATIDRARQNGFTDIAKEVIEERLSVVTDYAQLDGSSIVIESVPEIVELKREVISRVRRAVGHGVPIGSNTSSIAIGSLQEGLPGAESIGGLHFFNPVPASALIEIVVGPFTGLAIVDLFQDFARSLDKEAIVVNDAPGFATSRLGVALGLEAIRMLEDKVASAADIDQAMVLGYRHPIGPLRLTDLVGLDVRLAIARYLERMLGERFTPPKLLISMVEAGRLGKKSGEGFFVW